MGFLDLNPRAFLRDSAVRSHGDSNQEIPSFFSFPLSARYFLIWIPARFVRALGFLDLNPRSFRGSFVPRFVRSFVPRFVRPAVRMDEQPAFCVP